ncbi:FRG domain-containing protein [Deinococcus sp. JMULE3]|uniref:FRG domain-containing protein n=1 Tax=Deinococcus sp. JMULE3 TaxID=2518341 RepID=UPI0015758237|nr:FRG domain-containing protein [Deinococcus sp. JMULE3]NTY02071.1 FRG domain-containing protein [Deinococcus sp. JMULE3]
MVIEDIDNLIKWLLKFDSGWAFRGQTKDWPLEPNISRILPPDYPNARAVTTEMTLMGNFRAAARHYSTGEDVPSSNFSWVSLMQHYGGATRLLDFTSIPMVGLFFAFDGVVSDEGSSVIWAYNYREINKRSIQILKDIKPKFDWTYEKFKEDRDDFFDHMIFGDTSDTIWITEPSYYNLRLLRQGGTFLIKGNIAKPSETIFTEKYSDSWREKIEIPHSLRSEVIDLLNKCGMSNQSIYPGLEGLAKDVKSKLIQSSKKAAIAAARSGSK